MLLKQAEAKVIGIQSDKTSPSKIPQVGTLHVFFSFDLFSEVLGDLITDLDIKTMIRSYSSEL